MRGSELIGKRNRKKVAAEMHRRNSVATIKQNFNDNVLWIGETKLEVLWYSEIVVIFIIK